MGKTDVLYSSTESLTLIGIITQHTRKRTNLNDAKKLPDRLFNQQYEPHQKISQSTHPLRSCTYKTTLQRSKKEKHGF